MVRPAQPWPGEGQGIICKAGDLATGIGQGGDPITPQHPAASGSVFIVANLQPPGLGGQHPPAVRVKGSEIVVYPLFPDAETLERVTPTSA